MTDTLLDIAAHPVVVMLQPVGAGCLLYLLWLSVRS